MKQIRVNITSAVFIDADKLMMYEAETGQVKPYSEIEDKSGWVLEDSVKTIQEGDEIEFEEISFEEVD